MKKFSNISIKQLNTRLGNYKILMISSKSWLFIHKININFIFINLYCIAYFYLANVSSTTGCLKKFGFYFIYCMQSTIMSLREASDYGFITSIAFYCFLRLLWVILKLRHIFWTVRIILFLLIFCQWILHKQFILRITIIFPILLFNEQVGVGDG